MMLVFLGSPAYTHVQQEEEKKEMLGDLHVGQVKPNQKKKQKQKKTNKKNNLKTKS